LIIFKEEKHFSTDAVDIGKIARSFSKIFICGNKPLGHFNIVSNLFFGKSFLMH